MIFEETTLKGSYTVKLEPFSDNRGWFARTFCKDEFEKALGHDKEWVQLNHSFTKHQGTIRGMHYQLSPFREIKLVRCISGAVYDVIIDLRKGSPTFLSYYGVEISARNQTMIYIPEGFAHGFQALTDDCELVYHHTAMYTPGVEGGILFDDPKVNITWPLPVTIISDRDRTHTALDTHFSGL